MTLRIGLSLLTIIFTSTLWAQIDTIKYNGPTDHLINFVIVGDGYTQADLDNKIFKIDAEGFVQELFEESPFKEYGNFFNVFAVPKPSNNRGADHPGTATDVTEPKSPVQNVDIRYSSTFDYFNIHRLLVPTNSSAIYADLSSEFPAWDQIIVLVNESEYGGSGGSLATTSTHSAAGQIAIHELGHSFANLRDEYYAGDYYAREGINMTQETDPQTVLWTNWYDFLGVGIYQHCCGGQSAEWYRPHQSCKMRYLSSPFCSVCKEAIIDKIYKLTTPLLDSLPLDNALPIVSGQNILFGGTLIYPILDSLKIEWFLNDELIESRSTESELFESNEFTPGENSLVMKITDTTQLSRSYWPYAGYDYTITWEITKEACSENLELSMDHTTNTVFTANQTIESNSQVIENQTTYQAGFSITLEEAFEVHQGAIFQITIGGCP